MMPDPIEAGTYRREIGAVDVHIEVLETTEDVWVPCEWLTGPMKGRRVHVHRLAILNGYQPVEGVER